MCCLELQQAPEEDKFNLLRLTGSSRKSDRSDSSGSSVTSLAPEVAQALCKKPFRSRRGEVESILGKHSLLSK